MRCWTHPCTSLFSFLFKVLLQTELHSIRVQGEQAVIYIQTLNELVDWLICNIWIGRWDDILGLSSWRSPWSMKKIMLLTGHKGGCIPKNAFRWFTLNQLQPHWNVHPNHATFTFHHSSPEYPGPLEFEEITGTVHTLSFFLDLEIISWNKML